LELVIRDIASFFRFVCDFVEERRKRGVDNVNMGSSEGRAGMEKDGDVSEIGG
jgi:hypothetical protein